VIPPKWLGDAGREIRGRFELDFKEFTKETLPICAKLAQARSKTTKSMRHDFDTLQRNKGPDFETA
jgi:hypothetical protein